MKLNKAILMGLITMVPLSFSAYSGPAKSADKPVSGKTEVKLAPQASSETNGPVIKILDANGPPVAKAGITIIITCPNNKVIKLKTGDDGTVALPVDKVTYPASFTAESPGHTYIPRKISKASDIYGNKVVIVQSH